MRQTGMGLDTTRMDSYYGVWNRVSRYVKTMYFKCRPNVINRDSDVTIVDEYNRIVYIQTAKIYWSFGRLDYNPNWNGY